MVPSLVYESDANNANGTVANLNNNAMMHHFVLLNPQRTDTVCPGGLQGQLGERFFAAGNERSQMHLPGPYGYFNRHPDQLDVDLPPRQQGRGGEEHQHRDRLPVPHRRRRGCDSRCGSTSTAAADSEYPAPIGYSDTHADWTSTVSGRMIAMNGHLHDVDITNASSVPRPLSGSGPRHRVVG